MMKANTNRRCETCKHWFRNDEDMLPLEDRHTIAGVCSNSGCMSYDQNKLPHHGIECRG